MGKYRINEPVTYLEEGNRGNNSVVIHKRPADLVSIDDTTAAGLGEVVEPRGVPESASTEPKPPVEESGEQPPAENADARARGRRGQSQ